MSKGSREAAEKYRRYGFASGAGVNNNEKKESR